MIMRTSAIDRLIDEAIKAGIDTVLSLGAGLDTRPCRMRLPRGWEEKLRAAPILFKVRNWFEFFAQYGWRSSRVITNFEQAAR
jgi:hypothetical protein